MSSRTRKILFGALPSNLVYWSERDIKQHLLATMWNWSTDSTSMRRKLHIPGKSLWPFWDGYPFKGCWWPPTRDKKVRAWISWSKLLTLPKFNRKRPWKVKKGSSNHPLFRGVSCETWGAIHKSKAPPCPVSSMVVGLWLSFQRPLKRRSEKFHQHGPCKGDTSKTRRKVKLGCFHHHWRPSMYWYVIDV